MNHNRSAYTMALMQVQDGTGPYRPKFEAGSKKFENFIEAMTGLGYVYLFQSGIACCGQVCHKERYDALANSD